MAEQGCVHVWGDYPTKPHVNQPRQCFAQTCAHHSSFGPSGLELSEYCRRKGLYPEQIQAWHKTCMQANASVAVKVDQIQVRAQAKQLKQLEAELRRKDKALAETAALLVLQKKVQAIWGDGDDDTEPESDR